ncbi:MAG: hypothetical protein RLZZ436_1458 [Planctomycetota bacterium]|jgi:hypothetical protein
MSLEPEGSPESWPPLGLPTGSVRALLTLTVVGVVIQAVVRERTLDIIWTETLLIALAWYFTSRRFVALPPDVIDQLQREGVIERESSPLFLPRHSIRVILTGAFVGLGVWLYQQGRLFTTREFSLLLLVAAFIIGALLQSIMGWFRKRKRSRPSSRWGDFKALAVLSVVALAAAAELLPDRGPIPKEFDRIALAMMLFYFGSR